MGLSMRDDPYKETASDTVCYFFPLYHGEDKLHFDEMMMSALHKTKSLHCDILS